VSAPKDIAPRWESQRARVLFREVHERGHDLPLASVTRDGGVEFRADLANSVWNPGEDVSSYKRVVPGDFVIGLRSFQSGLGCSPLEGLVSPAYSVLRPRRLDMDTGFFRHLFKSHIVVSRLENIAQGIRQGRTIAVEDFNELRLPLPPLSVQRAIANYLDRETAQIDAMIAARRRMVELLRERQASWLYAVLANVKEIVVPLKSVARWVEGPGIMSADFRDEGVPLLRIRNLVGGTVDLMGCGYVPPSLVQQKWKHLCVRTGELLVSGSARSGTPVVVPPEANGAVPYTGLIRMWPTSKRLKRDFLRLFLASPMFDDQIDRLKTGVGLQHWGPYHLAQISLPLPSTDEQLALAARFAVMEQRSRRLTELHEDQVGLLQERRHALIAGAVTGQLDIPEAA
jgi:type I restriction enzyme, S subunit